MKQRVSSSTIAWASGSSPRRREWLASQALGYGTIVSFSSGGILIVAFF